MGHPKRILLVLAALWTGVLLAGLESTPSRAAEPPEPASEQLSPLEVLQDVLHHWADAVEPPEGTAAQTLTMHVQMTRVDGVPQAAKGATADILYQAPSMLRLSVSAAGRNAELGRDGNEVWAHAVDKKFALVGKSGLQLFRADPAQIDDTVLPPFTKPLSKIQMAALPLILRVEQLAGETLGGERCQVLRLSPRRPASNAYWGERASIELAVRDQDRLPARVRYTDGGSTSVEIVFDQVHFSAPVPAERWKLHAGADVHVRDVPLAHLVRAARVAPSFFGTSIPPLGPATGARRVVAVEGKGRLEQIDGTRVLFVKGSPEEMGHQQGVLLKPEIRDVMDRVLYGVGVISSFEKGTWVFGEIEDAEARLQPFIDARYLQEMDAIAAATGSKAQEARLANFFPELFHCSGFSLFGKAVADGHMYQGRVLDYLRGVGLEQNAVVIVHQPSYGHAWVNLSYAGFVGTVTAMNEKGISVGEMGGRGEGRWDGKPMAQILREVMEKSDTLDDALRILKAGPRTCQYYYVVSDGKAKRAVGIAATPDTFETIDPGQSHALLPHPQPDTVLMSAGSRYETLAQRVRDGYGRFDADSARALMSPPVCMQSNIQSVLFEPDTLDFWVANADSSHVASETRFTHYNLRTLLDSDAGAPQAKLSDSK